MLNEATTGSGAAALETDSNSVQAVWVSSFKAMRFIEGFLKNEWWLLKALDAATFAAGPNTLQPTRCGRFRSCGNQPAGEISSEATYKIAAQPMMVGPLGVSRW